MQADQKRPVKMTGGTLFTCRFDRCAFAGLGDVLGAFWGGPLAVWGPLFPSWASSGVILGSSGAKFGVLGVLEAGHASPNSSG